MNKLTEEKYIEGKCSKDNYLARHYGILSDKSVEGRNRLQRSGLVHPLTCGNDKCRKLNNQAPLLATNEGWRCEYCNYRQKYTN